MAVRDGDPLDPLRDLEARLIRDDPRFAREFGSGRPCRPREYRYRSAGLGGALAGAVFVAVGVMIGQGVLLVAGLLLLGVGVYLVCPAPVDGDPASRSGRFLP